MNLMTPTILVQLKSWLAAGKVYKFYSIKEWRKLRAIAKKRDRNECQRCKRRGKYTRADMVHHIKHVINFPELALTLSNLESLCNRCHNEEHPEKLARYQNKKKFINEERW